LNPGEAATDCDPFILSTLHGSKGLEWDNVILIGLNEQEFPGGKPDDVYSVRTSMNTSGRRGNRGGTSAVLCRYHSHKTAAKSGGPS
jgi:superfamily I DNA/RNA helicase